MSKIIDLDYSYIFNAASNGMSFTDFDSGRIIDVNKAWIDITGIARETAIGKTAYELGLWASQVEREQCVTRLHQIGNVVDVEIRLITRGIENLFLVQAKSVHIENQHYALWEFKNITEGKRMEDALSERESRLNTLIQTIPDLVWMKDSKGVYLSCNKRFERFFGASEKEIIGRTDYDFVDKRLADSYRENDQVAMTKGTPSLNEEWVTFSSDGHRELLETTKTPVLDARGQLIGILGIGHDITKRHQNEIKLAESEARFRNIMEHAPIGIAITSLDGRFLMINQALCDIVGYSMNELVKLTYMDITHPEDKALGFNDREKLLVSKIDSYQLEKRYFHKDGRLKWVQVTSTCVIKEPKAQPYFVALIEDITERKQFAALISEKNSFLHETQIIAGLGTFSLNIQSGLWESSDVLNNIFGINDTYARSIEGWEALIHPEDQKMMSEYFNNEVLGHNALFDKEYRIIRQSDLAVRWVHGLGKLEFDGQGHPVKMLGTIQDITERNKIDKEMRIASTVFKAQEGMLVTDAQSVILRVNDAFTQITGFTSEDVIGKTPHILSSGRHDSAFYTAMWECINRTGSWEGEIWNKRKNSEVYPEHLTISAVRAKDGNITNYVATLTDITMSKKAADEIKNLAFYDPLTQLPNRRLLQDRLFQALSSSDRSGQGGAILFLDLDNFKIINDTLGHTRGDFLLQEVAERLTCCVREGDTVARLGGDEFVLILEDLSKQPIETAAQAEVVAEKILKTLNQPYRFGKRDYFNSPSIGITLFNGHETTSDELFKQADIAMYQAKNDGRNTIRFFDPKMQIAIVARSALESELRSAVECRQFFLYYQIQMDYLQNPIGAEALIRWVHPTRNIVTPAEFIPIAEETGLILRIGNWVLNAACLQLSKWQMHEATRDLVLSVNVSAKQFLQACFADEVKEIIVRCGINPTRLKLELTESILLDNIQNVTLTMNALGALGVRFSLDDFGTGYSSLQYLKQLPLHQLKIDQSFVRDLAVDNSDKAIVDTVISMAHSLNLDVIAEGVETEEQRLYLENAGCPNYQGYLFSKPVPIKEFEALVKKYHDENQLYSATSTPNIAPPPQIKTNRSIPTVVDVTNESLEIFTWNESFSTGIPQIDEQHKHLVHLINVLASSIASKAGMPALDKIFSKLSEYAVYHFKTEESIWHEYLQGDALETSHNLVHESFISQVLRLKEAEGAKSQNEVVENLLSFLTNWLAFHILDSDKRMAMVVVAMQSGMTLEKAKQHVTRGSSGSMRALIGANLSMYNQLSRRTLQLMKEVNERKALEERLLQIESENA